MTDCRGGRIWFPKRIDEERPFVTSLGIPRVYCTVKVRIDNVDLVRIDADDWTVTLVQFCQPEDVLAFADHILIKFVPI